MHLSRRQMAAAMVLLVASTALGAGWTRNTFPGPGHAADPGYPFGEGQDRVQWMPGFHVSPLDGDFKYVFDNMGSGHFSHPDSNGREFWPIPNKSFSGCAAMGFSTHVTNRAYLIWTDGNAESPWGADWIPDDQINGIWKTTDGGNTYTHIKKVPNGHYLPGTRPWGKRRILEDPHPARSEHIWYGSYTEGLMRSTNGGAIGEWELISFTNRFIKTLSAVVDGDDTIMYVIVGEEMPPHVDGTVPAPVSGDTRQLPDEVDDGELWQFVISGSGSITSTQITAYTDFVDVEVNPNDINEVWVLRTVEGTKPTKGGASYVYRYVMNGSTVVNEQLELSKADINNHQFGYIFINPANVDHIVVQNNAMLEYALIYSTDGGATWGGNPRGTTGGLVHLPSFNPIEYHRYNPGDPGTSYMQNSFSSVKGPRVGFEPGDPDDVYWYTSNHETTLLRSTDGGATFMPYGYGTGCKEIRQVSICNNDNDMAVGLGEYGFCTTHDGGKTWRGATYENDSTLNTLSTSAETDRGIKASKTHVGMGVAINPANPDVLIGAYSGAAYLVRSEDGGLHWSLVSTNLPNWSSVQCYWSASDTNYVYAGDQCSTNGGVSWNPMDYYIRAMSAGTNEHLAGSANSISLTKNYKLYFSKDKGSSWIQLPVIPKETMQLRGGGSVDRNIRSGAKYAVAIDPRADCNPDVPGDQIRVLVAGRSGIYDYVAASETDGVSGGTWTVRNTGLVNSAHYNKVDPVPWMGSAFFDPRPGYEHVVYASKTSNVKSVLGSGSNQWGSLDNLNHDYPKGNTKAAIYKSVDGGLSWTDIHSGSNLPEWFQIRDVTVSSSGRLCVSAWDAGLYFYPRHYDGMHELLTEFTVDEGYVDGELVGQQGWTGDTDAFNVNTNAPGTVAVSSAAAWHKAYYPGLTGSSGTVFTVGAKFSFTETTAAAVNQNLFRIEFAATDHSAASLSLKRQSDGTYRLGFFENSDGNSSQAGTAFNAAAIGTTNGPGSAADWLYMELSLTKGSTVADWMADASIYNLTDDPHKTSALDSYSAAFTSSADFFSKALRPGINSANQSAANVSSLIVDSLYLEPVPSAFMQWAAGYGLSGTDAEQSANFDGDWLNNLCEYGLGGNPTNGNDVGYVPVFGTSGGNMEYTHVTLADPYSGIDYIVETNTNLMSGTWTTSGVTTVTGSMDDDFNLATNTMAMGSHSKGFMRLRILGIE